MIDREEEETIRRQQLEIERREEIKKQKKERNRLKKLEMMEAERLVSFSLSHVFLNKNLFIVFAWLKTFCWILSTSNSFMRFFKDLTSKLATFTLSFILNSTV